MDEVPRVCINFVKFGAQGLAHLRQAFCLWGGGSGGAWLAWRRLVALGLALEASCLHWLALLLYCYESN
jgi:hypothetical protein